MPGDVAGHPLFSDEHHHPPGRPPAGRRAAHGMLGTCSPPGDRSRDHRAAPDDDAGGRTGHQRIASVGQPGATGVHRLGGAAARRGADRDGHGCSAEHATGNVVAGAFDDLGAAARRLPTATPTGERKLSQSLHLSRLLRHR